jgi:hypothetical protein
MIVLSSTMDHQPARIIWPSKYAPENNPIHAVNELDIPATPEEIWDALVRVSAWPGLVL